MGGKFGLSVALATPLDNSGRIDVDRMIAQARRCLEGGCSSVTLFGTTGEGCSAGMQERVAILDAFLAAGIAPHQIVVGVLVDSMDDASTQAADALQKGVRNILLAPPSYFKNVSDDGLFDWFTGVFIRLGEQARDILVYNIPSVTMVSLSVNLIGKLHFRFPGVVVGVKDSSGDWAYTEALLKSHSSLIILIGDERHLARGVRLGGQGAISGMANFLTSEVKAMAVDGKDDQRIVDFVAELLKYPVTAAVKVMIALSTGDERWIAVRAPLVSISPQGRQALSNAFDSIFRARAV